MIKEIKNSDTRKLLPFLYREKEINLFAIGDIENSVFDNKNVKLFVVEEDEDVKGVLLKYFDSFVAYLPGTMNYRSVTKLMLENHTKTVSGKAEHVDLLKPFLAKESVNEKIMFFSKLFELKQFKNDDDEVRLASESDAPEILELLSKISEFDLQNAEAFITSMRNGSSRKYFIRRNGKIVSTASTAAECKDMAMIIGVATDPEYRKQGLATKIMSKMCLDLLKENKTVCLFYDNPAAGKIYERIGFRQIALWKMVYLRDSE